MFEVLSQSMKSTGLLVSVDPESHPELRKSKS